MAEQTELERLIELKKMELEAYSTISKDATPEERAAAEHKAKTLELELNTLQSALPKEPISPVVEPVKPIAQINDEWQQDDLERLRAQKRELDTQTEAMLPDENDFAMLGKLVPTKESAAAYVAASEVDYFPLMRKLNIGDLGKLAKIIGSNLKELMPVFAPVLQGDGKLDAMGLIGELEMAAPKALGELYDILVNVAGLSSREEFEKIELAALPYLINRLLAENDLTGFLTQAFKLAERLTQKQTNQQALNGMLSQA